MRLERAWQLSMYLTLAMACACLGYAELAFFKWFPFFLIPVAALLVLAYRVEGRWVLPVWVANALAVAITAGSVAGMVIMFRLYVQGISITDIPIPWPTALVPPVGPLLVVLLLIKLFRPKKLHDWWLLQTMAFLQVALACVLAGEAGFGLLLVGYVASALWSLALFQIKVTRDVPNDGDRVPWRWLGVGKTLRWTLGALGLGLVLFLVLPRQPDTLWDSARLASSVHKSIEIGNADGMDLSSSGTLRMSHEVAFRVIATDAQGLRKLDLGPHQLWRSYTLEVYDRGVWMRNRGPGLLNGRVMQPMLPGGGGLVAVPGATAERIIVHENKGLPDLGPHQFYLKFEVDPKQAGGLVLAEPVILGPEREDHPYITLSQPGFAKLKDIFYERDGTLFPLRSGKDIPVAYRQVLKPPEPGAADLHRPRYGVDDRIRAMRENYDVPMRKFRDFTLNLLEGLAETKRFGLESQFLVIRQNGMGIQIRYQEVVARALAAYLARSGDYTYSLTLRHKNPAIDPTLDFLQNVREGYCEQYASALALMLRSVGISARVVRGFRGVEHEGEGKYVVRQSDAHSWVEALIVRPMSKSEMRAQLRASTSWMEALAKAYRKNANAVYWLALDPTPSEDAEGDASESWSLFWQKSVHRFVTFWRTFLVELNPNIQEEAVEDLWKAAAPGQRLAAARDWILDSYSGRFWSKPGFWIITPVAVGLLAWFIVRRRAAQTAGREIRHPAFGFYSHLLAVLDRRCRLRPLPAQTPREFGETAQRALHDRAAPEALAGLPGRVVELFYQLRFGDKRIDQAARSAVERELDELDQKLS
jgi:hypothetical protein